MIRPSIWLYTFVPAILFVSACGLVTGNVVRGSGRVVSETRAASGFDEIEVCCGMQLILSQGQSESLEIEAEDNVLPEIVSDVFGRKLTVHFDNPNGTKNFRLTRPIRVMVSAIDLRGLIVTGGGSLEVGPFESDQLDLELSGGSRAELQSMAAELLEIGISGGGRFSAQELRVNELTLDLSGGSNVLIQDLQGESLILEASGGGIVEIAGSVTGQLASLSGGADYQAGDLESQETEIRMSGGGQATVWVHESLDADLGGGARLDYFGAPQVTQELSGGSRIEARGDR
jgi:hypothetical protein